MSHLARPFIPLNCRPIPKGGVLHCAVGYFEPKNGVLEMILDAGPDLAAKDAEGRSPLHRAAIIGNVKGATALLDKQADVRAKDKEGATPLHHAAKVGGKPMITLLIDRGAPVDARDDAGRTPLDWATKADVQALLTERGAAAK